jgi:branched-chain amino acid transport system substrate-binding protein
VQTIFFPAPSPDIPGLTPVPPFASKRRGTIPSAGAVLFSCLSLLGHELPAAETSAQAEIVLGMSTALTGSAQNLGRDMELGVLTGLARANRNGGVHDRKVRLITLDDGYEPARTAPNTERLIEKENVLAIIGNVGTPNAIVSVPLANEQKTLLFAPFSGGPILRNEPPDRYVINFRASYTEEIAAIVDALIDIAGLKPSQIAFFTQRDGYGDAGFTLGLAALQRHQPIEPQAILRTGYERNTLAVEGAVADLMMAKTRPRAVVMIGAYAPCARFIRLCRDSDLNPLFLNVSFVGSQWLAAVLGNTDAQIVVTQVVPDPLDDRLPIAGEYRADLKVMNSSACASFGDFEGYIAARILTLALERIQGAPTREAIVDALENLGHFDIGLGEPMHLSPTDHQASHRVWPTVLKEGHFLSFQWSDIKALVQGAGSQ